MKICFVTSECVPYVKTGGLGDVSGALPRALATSGAEVKVFMPLYGDISTVEHDLTFCEDLYESRVSFGDRTVTYNAWYGRLPGSTAEVYFIDCPHYYHRGSVYTGDADEDERFLLLQHAAFGVMQRYGWAPDIIHANDWPTALMPVLAREVYGWDGLFAQAGTVLSVHNIGYQGRFPLDSAVRWGLPGDHASGGGAFDMNGSFSWLKAGLLYADAVTTVSPSYAREIQTAEYGAGLEGVLQSRASRVFGILNGIDTDEWNPATDPHIPQTYDADSIDLKLENKRILLHQLGLPFQPGIPLFGIVSRLTGQKGFELLQPILEPMFSAHGFQLVVLGSGERTYEDFFRGAADRFPDQVSAYLGFNNKLAHGVEAGADLFLMPSAYEPCGLNQMYSLRYGTVPVVRKTGGLADTVFDFFEHDGRGNGVSFADFTPDALGSSMLRAVELFRTPAAWRTVQLRGMAGDFSWGHSAARYLDVYQLVAADRARQPA